MQFRILGPLQVEVEGVHVELGGPRRSALLAALVVRANRVCPSGQLLEAIWGEHSPPDALSTLQSHVAHLRRILEPERRPREPARVLRSIAGGYLLAVDPRSIDAHRLETLYELGRRQLTAGVPEEALDDFDSALALWRGEPLEGVGESPLVSGEAARLQALYLAAAEGRLEALLALGRNAEVAAEAERALREQPLRERLWELLVLALYRSGRQADALSWYRQARALLAEQLGVDPRPSLRALEAAILHHDPALSESDPGGGVPGARARHDTGHRYLAVPETRYARSGGVHIAYQVMGRGPWFVGVPPLAQNVEVCWESRYWRRFLERFAAETHFVHFDKRGTGMSDRVAVPALEERMDDIRAVMDAAGIDSAVVGAVSEGGPLAVLFAATYPERCRGLVLCGTFARIVWAPDYLLGIPPERYREATDRWVRSWGTPASSVVDDFTPSLAGDGEFRVWAAHYMRQSCSPGTLARLNEINAGIDVRHLLPRLRVPTLVLHRRGDRVIPERWGRYLSEHIAGASYRVVEGDDHLPWIGDHWDEIVDLAVQFTRGPLPPPLDVTRTLLTLLALSTASGQWRPGAEQVARDVTHREGGAWIPADPGGAQIVTFDSPRQALRAAALLRSELRAMGMELGAAVHAGEVERRGEGIGGGPVELARELVGRAEPGEIVVTAVVRDLLAGPGFTFRERQPAPGASTPAQTLLLVGVPGERGSG